jgi:hypothetical protein
MPMNNHCIFEENCDLMACQVFLSVIYKPNADICMRIVLSAPADLLMPRIRCCCYEHCSTLTV